MGNIHKIVVGPLLLVASYSRLSISIGVKRYLREIESNMIDETSKTKIFEFSLTVPTLVLGLPNSELLYSKHVLAIQIYVSSQAL